MLSDIQKFYNVIIEELPSNVAELLWWDFFFHHTKREVGFWGKWYVMFPPFLPHLLYFCFQTLFDLFNRCSNLFYIFSLNILSDKYLQHGINYCLNWCVDRFCTFPNEQVFKFEVLVIILVLLYAEIFWFDKSSNGWHVWHPISFCLLRTMCHKIWWLYIMLLLFRTFHSLGLRHNNRVQTSNGVFTKKKKVFK
jgi:hypothetical protein